MVLEIVKYGHPALRQKGAPVKQIDDKLIAEMQAKAAPVKEAVSTVKKKKK